MKINIVDILKKYIKKLVTIILIILILIILSNYYSKLCMIFITIIISITLLYYFKKNNVMKIIIQSYKELKQVSWPNYKDVVGITVIVIAVTIIMSLIIWGLDTLLINSISFITKLKI
ncbi:MAG: preprotein translocase subunit SecE [Candidatus Lightella neohaematopini]|nr:preprotein translocase subunit SecE [Candidatus Lightella neohaematopini]MCV2528843.1 preprotein translocase subunit SecE [Candidatus Lightella neohaematopini]